MEMKEPQKVYYVHWKWVILNMMKTKVYNLKLL